MGSPVLVLPSDYERQKGKDAQKNNITAAKKLSETVRTTLGPKGMDKMLVDSIGGIVVTNDGVAILEEMEIEHPAADMVKEVAKTQEDEVGDGTTTAAVLAGELLSKAESLLDENIHPTIVTRGYRMALKEAEKVLDEMVMSISLEEEEELRKIAMTAMTGKSAENAREKLAKLIVGAVKQVVDKQGDDYVVSREDIKMVKEEGKGIEDSELIQGIVLDKERVHSDMPGRVDDAKVLLVDSAIEVKETETDAEIQITDPSKLKGFLEQEESMLKELVENIREMGANVVFCQKGIDDVAQHFLAKHGILALRRVKKSDMKKLARATGAKIVTSIEDAEKSDLGKAGVIEQRNLSGENMTFVRHCKNPKAVTLLIRGGTEHVIDEVKRAVDDAMGDLMTIVKDKKAVPGGGAPEIMIALHLKEYADSLSGREQLAVKAFAECLEIIPKTLAENAGLDSIDTLVRLKAEHDKGNFNYGISIKSENGVGDMVEEGVIEPSRVKLQAIKSASEVSTMILRIDDVIAAKGEGSEGGGPGGPGGPGGMPGAGGMPGGMGGLA